MIAPKWPTRSDPSGDDAARCAAAVLARDVVRYLDLIVVFGWLTMLVGAALTAIDFVAGMPPMWSWTEGPPTVLVGAAYVWLARCAR